MHLSMVKRMLNFPNPKSEPRCWQFGAGSEFWTVASEFLSMIVLFDFPVVVFMFFIWTTAIYSFRSSKGFLIYSRCL